MAALQVIQLSAKLVDNKASNQNEERGPLVIHKSKITDHNYISTILSTYPLKFSTNRELIPQFLNKSTIHPFKCSTKYWMRYSLHMSMIFYLKLGHTLMMKFESEAR